MTETSDISRGPGRPKKGGADPNLRHALLKQAEQMFAERGYDGVSMRGLADAAGLTPAMIHYYFKNKQGLYAAMLDDVTGRLLEQIEQAVAANLAATAAGEAVDDPFRTLMDVASRTVLAEPWAVTLILREVLLQPGPLRDQFIETYADKMLSMVRALIGDAMVKGELRADLNKEFTAAALLGLTAFPFLARGVIEPVLGLDYSEEMRSAYIDHAANLFHHGVNATGQENPK